MVQIIGFVIKWQVVNVSPEPYTSTAHFQKNKYKFLHYRIRYQLLR